MGAETAQLKPRCCEAALEEEAPWAWTLLLSPGQRQVPRGDSLNLRGAAESMRLPHSSYFAPPGVDGGTEGSRPICDGSWAGGPGPVRRPGCRNVTYPAALSPP